jgi:hypothetical protein
MTTPDGGAYSKAGMVLQTPKEDLADQLKPLKSG